MFGKNLLRSLSFLYPDKAFIVYLQIDPREGLIIRFHQIWQDEPLYYEKKMESGRLRFFETHPAHRDSPYLEHSNPIDK